MDGGSTHNFKQAKLANKSIPSFSVVVGSGQNLCCDGVVRGVPLDIQGYDLPMDLYVLSLHGADVILDVSWLQTLEPVVTNYATRIFELSLNGSPVRWVGNSPTEMQPVQLHSLRCLATTDSIASCCCLTVTNTGNKTIIDEPSLLTPLLESSDDVF